MNEQMDDIAVIRAADIFYGEYENEHGRSTVMASTAWCDVDIPTYLAEVNRWYDILYPQKSDSMGSGKRKKLFF